MTTTAKVSVAIGRDELAWAKRLARLEGKSLSAIVTESLAERRRLAALAEVVTWMGEGQPPLSDEAVEAARRELTAGTPPRTTTRSSSRKGTRRSSRTRRR